jgi:uncharacterized protein YgbK (DUF1537 family)
LREALLDEAPLFFVLTNTRSMRAQQAADITREVCHNLKEILAYLKEEGVSINPIVVSRSDSTLRGHYPVETDIIAEELGPFDAHFLVPAFFEGGRITRDSVHYLMVEGKPVAVHDTEFAKDSVFGFSTAYLPDYVQEKTKGRIQANEVERFLFNDVRSDMHARLMALNNNVCCVVDAEQQSDLDNFCKHLQTVANHGKRFLFRSAASLLTSLAHLPPQSVKPEAMAAYVREGKPGAIIVGSHVQKTTAQLQQLLNQEGVVPLEVDVDQVDANRDVLFQQISAAVHRAHADGLTPVIFTSRVEKVFPDENTRLAFGERVSNFLMDVVRALPESIGFLISKGGITSNDVLSHALALRASRVVGQILAGCSVVCCPSDHQRFPNLPVVIFPGNVGDEFGLATVYNRLRA